MELKVGDKVKIVDPLEFSVPSDWVYRITTILPSYFSFDYRIESTTGWQCLMYNKEIEKIPTYAKGEQLLFPFMKQ